MEENYTTDNVRSRLILAGLKELDRHGVVDFSLRRVAIEAGVSCAAPYRHFKDKDDLISSIISYVMEGWTLLAEQIEELFTDDARTLVAELAVAGLRFWIANGNFRTVIMNLESPSGEDGPMADFERPLIKSISENFVCEDSKRVEFTVLSSLYGAISLVDGGCYAADEASRILRMTILDTLARCV